MSEVDGVAIRCQFKNCSILVLLLRDYYFNAVVAVAVNFVVDTK